MFPEEHADAASRALRESFGVAAADDVQDLTERPGSNRAFRIVVRGSTYFLRINTRRGDMARHIQCMKAAAEAGLSPALRYADVDNRISVTDFVRAAPLPAHEARYRLPAVLRALHALPPFPPARFNTTCTFLLAQGPILDAFLQSLPTTTILYKRDLDQLLAHYTRIIAALSRLEPELAPCHNDLFKPDNILFDGDRVWLVDWEAAFQNDRYADLAVVANMLCANEAEEQIYLQQYFGAPPDERQSARFYLMQQLAHIFYVMAFLNLSSADKPVDWNELVPAYSDYQRLFWAGDAGLADQHDKVVYGRVQWERLKHNLLQPRFEESLRIVG